jgi:hypothetical protein
MKTTDAIKYFGTSYAMAKALGLMPTVVYRWGVEPPPLRQFQIAHATGGALQVNPEFLPKTFVSPRPRPITGSILREAPARMQRKLIEEKILGPAPGSTVEPKKRMKARPVSLSDIMAASGKAV